MSFEIKVPAVGESITSGLVSEWHKKDGEPVDKGDLLVTIETDKVSTEIAAEEAGVLEISVPADEEVEIGAVLGYIREGEKAEKDESDERERTAEKEEPPAEEKAPKPEPAEAEKPEEPEEPAEAEKPAAMDDADRKGDGNGGAGAARRPVPKEPVVPGFSVVQHEIARGAGDGAERNGKAGAGEGRFTRKKMSPLRRKIATHLVNAQQTAAILTTFNECDMSAVMKLRKEVQESFVAKHGVKLGFMSFFIKAAVQALRDVPQVNARIDGDDLIINHYFDIGVAVGTEKGLIVPVIRECESKSFADIERDIGDFATRARDAQIRIEELQGGVFTISNGGIYGSLLSTPILNPPQSGILGMHAIQERPVAINGSVEVRPMMYLALSYDHRVVDGKEAVTFLVRVKEAIENPARLLVGA